MCAVVAYDSRGHGNRLSGAVTLASSRVGTDARLAFILSPLVYMKPFGPHTSDIIFTSGVHSDVRC